MIPWTTYLPWWGGALGLASVAIGFHYSVGKPFGFSGTLEKIIYPKETTLAAEADAFFSNSSEQELTALLEAATQNAMQASAKALSIEPAAPAPLSKGHDLSAGAWGYLSQILFVLGILLGGLLDFWLSSPTLLALSPASDGHPLKPILACIAGGLLVGFGTRLGGGCTSGHGLFGCGQGQIASVLATCLFLSTAIATTFALHYFYPN